MDTAATIFGVSAAWVAILGAFFFLLIWFGGKKLGTSVASGRILMVIGALICVAGLIVMWGVGAPGLLVDRGATYDLSMTESENQTVVDADTMVWYINVEFNYTGDGTFEEQSATSEVNFTLDRTDTSSEGDTTRVECTDAGLVADEAESKSYSLVSQGISYNINWSKAQQPDAATVTTVTKKGLGSTLRIEAGGSNWVLCNITLNADAIDAMPQFDQAFAYLSIGGVQVQVIVRVIVVHDGTAPT